MSGRQVRAEIFCGATIPGRNGNDRAEVSSYMFSDFLKAYVTFPGYTVVEAVGYWKDSDPTKWSGREITRVIVLYGPEGPAFRAEVRKIADNYRIFARQDAVAVGIVPAYFYLATTETFQ